MIIMLSVRNKNYHVTIIFLLFCYINFCSCFTFCLYPIALCIVCFFWSIIIIIVLVFSFCLHHAHVLF